ncbi:MAG TPA: metallophosphoesterase [Verrucomicrobiae bacterium]
MNPVLLLRFRDLATALGQTIERHQEKSREFGSVWWGWWSKGGEQVPQALFTKLNESPFTIYLFDSFQLKLYRAKCEEIRFSPKGDLIPSPAPNATPDYYKDQKYLAWFKLSSIEEGKETEITGFTNVEVAEFFVTESPFKAYEGTKVTSLKDLKLLERSIYFLRNAEGRDKPLDEVLKTPLSQPAEPFVQDFKVSPHHALLWISDLHFGENHGFPTGEEVTKRQLWDALYSACREHNIQPAGIIASGDFTWAGTSAPFKDAATFLSKLTSVLGLQERDVLIVPGNHDIARTTATGIGLVSKAESEGYRSFYKEFYKNEPNEFLSVGRRFVLGNTHAVEIVGLNSVSLSQMKDFSGFGYVGQKQMGKAVEAYGWDKDVAGRNHPVRIVVMHHHLLPVNLVETPGPNPNYSMTLDAEAVTQWAIENRVSVVLHGHMHTVWNARIHRPKRNGIDDLGTAPALNVCALGSTGVAKTFHGSPPYNTFGAISCVDGTMRLKIFSIQDYAKSELLLTIDMPVVRAPYEEAAHH